MGRFLTLFALPFVIAFVAAHYWFLGKSPSLIMTKAFQVFEETGVGRNSWAQSPQTTPDYQPVVRASPDLSYTICVLDLSDGPVQVSGAKWDGYGSLSIFDSDTRNVFTTSLTGDEGEFARVFVASKSEGLQMPEGAATVELDGDKGIALIRRLAPDAETRGEVEQLADLGRCDTLK